jgi:hypothetical protein
MDWRAAFEAFRPHRPTHVESVDEGVSTAPFRRQDVAEIAYLAAGEGDGPPWIAVVRLTDGRWAYVSYTVQITGDIYHTFVVGASKERLWRWALTDEDRDRFTPQMTRDDRERELVDLDQMLESTDPEARAWAEARMRRLWNE